ncbi:MAG: TetR/AcrR family transcriptional regulator [Acidimicrobiales bacterium]
MSGPRPSAAGGDRSRLSASERRDMILDVVAEVAVTESLDAVTMDEVAERCGVSRPLVYKHFANRDEMLGAVYRREARRLHAELASEVEAAESVEEMFRTLVRGALRAAGERGHLFATLRAGAAWSRQVRREQRSQDHLTAKAFARRAVEELGIDARTGPTAVALLLSLVDPVLAQWRQDPSAERAVLLEDAYMAIVSATLRDLAA